MIKKVTITLTLALFVISFMAISYAPEVLAHSCPAITQIQGNVITQNFPPSGQSETAWRVRYAHATGKGLYITGAWFKKGPNEPWMRVLWDARVSDIFVPYHSGSPRYYDLSNFSFNLVTATTADAGACGTILDNKVIVEVRDRGPLWKDDMKVHRGHSLVLWATLDSANYNYVMKYEFLDDGTISLRMGATSRNLPGRELEGHMHNALWRIDMDLNGFRHDTPLEAGHRENLPNASANDFLTLFGNWNREGSIDWEPEKFTELRVFDMKKTNGQGNLISYDFRPIRLGTPRHQENFAKADFWVTKYHWNETQYKLITSYDNNEVLWDTDIVIWHISPLHHQVRDEDGDFVKGIWKGVALLMWSGIDIRPRNLFDDTPHFP